MKKIVLMLIIGLPFFGKSQVPSIPPNENEDNKIISKLLVDGDLPIDSFYADKANKIIVSSILKFDGVSQNKLMQSIKNWAGIKFINLKQVLVSETDDQLVINYIDNSFSARILGTEHNSPRYIRLIIQAKDNKVRCQYFDDGNIANSTIDARVMFLTDYFKEKKGREIARSSGVDGLIRIKNSIISNLKSLELALKERKNNEEW